MSPQFDVVNAEGWPVLTTGSPITAQRYADEQTRSTRKLHRVVAASDFAGVQPEKPTDYVALTAAMVLVVLIIFAILVSRV